MHRCLEKCEIRGNSEIEKVKQTHILLAAQPQLLAPLWQAIHRVIAGFLVKRAGFKLSRADTGAVTLIQRFGLIPSVRRNRSLKRLV